MLSGFTVGTLTTSKPEGTCCCEARGAAGMWA